MSHNTSLIFMAYHVVLLPMAITRTIIGADTALVDIRNVYLEVTPARFVSAWCAEQGIACDPAELLRLTGAPP